MKPHLGEKCIAKSERSNATLLLLINVCACLCSPDAYIQTLPSHHYVTSVLLQQSARLKYPRGNYHIRLSLCGLLKETQVIYSWGYTGQTKQGRLLQMCPTVEFDIRKHYSDKKISFLGSFFCERSVFILTCCSEVYTSDRNTSVVYLRLFLY